MGMHWNVRSLLVPDQEKNRCKYTGECVKIDSRWFLRFLVVLGDYL